MSSSRQSAVDVGLYACIYIPGILKVDPVFILSWDTEQTDFLFGQRKHPTSTNDRYLPQKYLCIAIYVTLRLLILARRLSYKKTQLQTCMCTTRGAKDIYGKIPISYLHIWSFVANILPRFLEMHPYTNPSKDMDVITWKISLSYSKNITNNLQQILI